MNFWKRFVFFEILLGMDVWRIVERKTVCYIDGWSDDAKMGLKMFDDCYC